MSAAIEHLKWSLESLSHPATVQYSLFPRFVCVADELALNFDERFRAVSNHEFTPKQRSLLIALDTALADMSGPENADLWTDTALENNPLWLEIRQKARRALETFGWTLERPPSGLGSTYVGPTVG